MRKNGWKRSDDPEFPVFPAFWKVVRTFRRTQFARSLAKGVASAGALPHIRTASRLRGGGIKLS